MLMRALSEILRCLCVLDNHHQHKCLILQNPSRILDAVGSMSCLSDDKRGKIRLSTLHSLLEVLVQAELEGTLSRVSNHGGCPALEQTSNALLTNDHAKALPNALEPDGVNLHVALHHVHGGHSRVCEATAQDTTLRQRRSTGT